MPNTSPLTPEELNRLSGAFAAAGMVGVRECLRSLRRPANSPDYARSVLDALLAEIPDVLFEAARTPDAFQLDRQDFHLVRNHIAGHSLPRPIVPDDFFFPSDPTPAGAVRLFQAQQHLLVVRDDFEISHNRAFRQRFQGFPGPVLFGYLTLDSLRSQLPPESCAWLNDGASIATSWSVYAFPTNMLALAFIQKALREIAGHPGRFVMLPAELRPVAYQPPLQRLAPVVTPPGPGARIIVRGPRSTRAPAPLPAIQDMGALLGPEHAPAIHLEVGISNHTLGLFVSGIARQGFREPERRQQWDALVRELNGGRAAARWWFPIPLISRNERIEPAFRSATIAQRIKEIVGTDFTVVQSPRTVRSLGARGFRTIWRIFLDGSGEFITPDQVTVRQMGRWLRVYLPNPLNPDVGTAIQALHGKYSPYDQGWLVPFDQEREVRQICLRVFGHYDVLRGFVRVVTEGGRELFARQMPSAEIQRILDGYVCPRRDKEIALLLSLRASLAQQESLARMLPGQDKTNIELLQEKYEDAIDRVIAAGRSEQFAAALLHKGCTACREITLGSPL